MPKFRKPLAERHAQYYKRGNKRQCWLWVASTDRHGYGRILIYDPFAPKGHRSTTAHRVAYALHRGKVSDAKFVLHTCDNRACVNPNHLYLGTHLDNMADQRRRGRTKGEKQHNAKLTDADVRAIKRDTRYQYVIAKEYGVIQATISKIKLGKTWGHIK